MATTDVDVPPSNQPRGPEGRDHLNLAEFPISVLLRQQPSDADGRKLDTVVYRSSRYDPQTRRRVPQTVTLTTNSKSGLPTPADENVVLALMYMAKQAGNFSDPTVRFAPRHLFEVMGWNPNSRSYARLRAVLRRLKSLTLTYENAWWDKEGRRFEEEFATGVIASYRIARQTAGPRTSAAVPASWVVWNPDFFESLAKGSLKRLNLDHLFALQRPAAQRMYRYLDKHFYHAAEVELDLREFACGHVGLSEGYDIGKLKSKLQPAIEELEAIGFIAAAGRRERYRKIKPGVWRIRFEKPVATENGPADAEAAAGGQGSERPLEDELKQRGVTAGTARELVQRHDRETIREKIDAFDWLRKRRDAKVSRNPAGYLVASIRDDYAPPAGFESRADRQVRHERLQQQQARRDAERREERVAVDRYLQSLGEAERERLERDAFERANPFLRRQYDRAADGEQKRFHGETIVRQHVRELLQGRSNDEK